MSLIIILAVLFVIYKIYMNSTQKEREEMYKSLQEESTSPKKKKPIKMYSKGYVIHDINSLYFKPDFGYSSIGGLSIDDEKSFRMVVYDHKKKKHLGYIKDKRLFATLKEFPEHLCYINTPEGFVIRKIEINITNKNKIYYLVILGFVKNFLILFLVILFTLA